MPTGSSKWTVPVIALLLAVGAVPALAQQPDTAPTYVVPRGDAVDSVELGSLDPDSGYRMRVGLERGSVFYTHLTDYLYSALTDPGDPGNHYLILSKFRAGSNGGANGWIRPLAARTLTIDQVKVNLVGATWTLERVDRDDRGIENAATYRLTLTDQAGQPVVSIQRRYELAVNSYELLCRQTLHNLTDRPLTLQWEQLGPPDAPRDKAKYMGDRRNVVVGYTNRAYNPSQSIIFVDKAFQMRDAVLKGQPILPADKIEDNPADVSMAWLAMLNRYFAVAIHRPVTLGPDAEPDARAVPSLADLFPATRLLTLGQQGDDAREDGRRLVTVMASRPLTLGPQEAADLSLVLFTGPRKSELFAQPTYRALFFSKLIKYDIGGMCAFCTFQWLAHLLLGFMKLIHALTLDWGVAIIVLVLVVRAILHPITKRSQIQMTKFSKQMAAMKPELDKLKARYPNDPRKMQAEQAKLMREKGVNPVNMLGCAPMFLQTPIWIALYAMLFYAIELRHQPALWGVFQWISDGRWAFLCDLSSPDQFIRFADQPLHLNFPLLSALDLSSLNILPLLMGAAMFAQQRLMAQPAANEQQQQMQRMMSFMLLLFPLFLYSAPSGLTLYILASTGAGMLDSHLVRQHIKREEEAGTLLESKQAKAGGWRQRMAQWAQTRQAEIEARQKRLDGGAQHRYRDRKGRH